MLAEACVTVATHRHGCCVLQRAIDAATVDQSRLLVSRVSQHALQLMQVGSVPSLCRKICLHDNDTLRIVRILDVMPPLDFAFPCGPYAWSWLLFASACLPHHVVQVTALRALRPRQQVKKRGIRSSNHEKYTSKRRIGRALGRDRCLKSHETQLKHMIVKTSDLVRLASTALFSFCFCQSSPSPVG